MAQPGVSIQMSFARGNHPGDGHDSGHPGNELASRRAIKKTIRWLQTRVARGLAQALGVPQKALKHRLTVSEVGSGSDQVHILWLGVARWRRKRRAGHGKPSKGYLLAAASIPARSIRTCMAMALRRWIEKSRAAALGLSLPQWRRANKGRGTVGSLNWVALGIPVPAVAFQ